ncbi:MAG: glutaredoxin family protein [Gammaproteobacteria bacterium]|nr:glutaredoxin family protein [Gammaproteobacteria bacterium]
MNVRLFTTLGCHLCEQALAQLLTLRENGFAVDIVETDIANSDELMAKYGVRIPVIAREDNEELGWPFTLEELTAFLD